MITIKLRFDFAGAAERASSTGLLVGRAARIHLPGDSLRYPWGEEHRDSAELARVVAQLPGKPLVLQHPDPSPDNAYGIVADGAVAHVVGIVESARVDGDYAEVDLKITDDVGNRAIELGIRDLSMGYRCRSEDGWQRDTVVDHVALVRRGRCRGPGGACEVAVRGDCGCSVSDEVRRETEAAEPVVRDCACTSLANPPDVGHPALHMPDDKLLDEMNKKLADAHGEAAVQRARADQAEKSRDAEKARADAAEVEAINARNDLKQGVEPEKLRADAAESALSARNDAATKELADLRAEHELAIAKVRADESAERALAVDAKVALIAEAAPILERADLAKMSERDIKLAVIAHVDGDDYSDAKYDDSFVAGVYVGAVKRHLRAAGSRADAARVITEAREKTTEVVKSNASAKDAEKKALDDLRERTRLQSQNKNSKDKE